MTLCSASHTDSTAVWMASRTACACFGGQVALRQMVLLASGDRDHILSGVFNQFLSEKSEPAE